MEISGIPNRIPVEDLENTVVSIFKDSGVEKDPENTERCHRLPLSRNSREHDKICQPEVLESPIERQKTDK